ncbi:jg1078 [Pararge aegeria aegeria]|uniref:Jg1078 protein n=1 Tax=Pararge aegeria aegeria TaxID=348720 RepID=A0A8S4QWV3_9NEOP|nr:jg1078 [Pararge aegeria aegeria]
MVVLPPSFTGGFRYMNERTQYAMTYVRHYGRPNLFITCNLSVIGLCCGDRSGSWQPEWSGHFMRGSLRAGWDTSVGFGCRGVSMRASTENGYPIAWGPFTGVDHWVAAYCASRVLSGHAQHTLAECPRWPEPREALAAILGQDLSLPAVVKAMAGSDKTWEAMVSFCEQVMSQKEAAERLREDMESQPMRLRRIGRRRLAHERRLPP